MQEFKKSFTVLKCVQYFIWPATIKVWALQIFNIFKVYFLDILSIWGMKILKQQFWNIFRLALKWKTAYIFTLSKFSMVVLMWFSLSCGHMVREFELSFLKHTYIRVLRSLQATQDLTTLYYGKSSSCKLSSFCGMKA